MQPRWRRRSRKPDSMLAHYKRGAVDISILRAWWLPILIGVTAGSVVARYAPERLFKIVFVAVAYSAAARLILARETWKLASAIHAGRLAIRLSSSTRDNRQRRNRSSHRWTNTLPR